MDTICLTIVTPSPYDIKRGEYCGRLRDYLTKEYYPTEVKQRIYLESLAGCCPFRTNCCLFSQTLKHHPYQLDLFI